MYRSLEEALRDNGATADEVLAHTAARLEPSRRRSVVVHTTAALLGLGLLVWLWLALPGTGDHLGRAAKAIVAIGFAPLVVAHLLLRLNRPHYLAAVTSTHLLLLPTRQGDATASLLVDRRSGPPVIVEPNRARFGLPVLQLPMMPTRPRFVLGGGDATARAAAEHLIAVLAARHRP